jgi:tRNA A37 threonylcarbamoyladenosine biosynthesis protein TsaE
MKVNSPTYTYIQEYSNDSQASLKNHGNGKLLHIDMYNINEPQQLIEKGIAELVHEYDYVAIEWPKFLDVL